MRLALDLDGVLADFNTAFLDVCLSTEPRTEGLHGVSLAGRHFMPNTWDWPSDMQFNARAAWDKVALSKDFWRRLAPLPGVEDFLVRLWAWQHETEAEVLFLTHRHTGRRVKRQSEDWLVEHGWPRPTVLLCPGAKADACAALGVDLIVDDHRETIEDVRANGRRGVLMRAAYNTPHEGHPDEITALGQLFARGYL